MRDPLEAPRSVGDLYLYRRPDVSIMRPMMTGDIFKEVDIPGVEGVEGDDCKLGMLVSHPCSMRTGHVLKGSVQVIRVIRAQIVEFSAWKGHFDRMPLPNLFNLPEEDSALNPDDSYAAIFDLRGRVPTVELPLDNREVCLSEKGVGYLHQRMGHADTRFAPRTSDLVAACASPFAETELAETWNESLVNIDSLGTGDRDALFLRSAEDFDAVLSEQRESQGAGKKATKYTLREDLGDPSRLPMVRREILKAMKQRQPY